MKNFGRMMILMPEAEVTREYIYQNIYANPSSLKKNGRVPMECKCGSAMIFWNNGLWQCEKCKRIYDEITNIWALHLGA